MENIIYTVLIVSIDLLVLHVFLELEFIKSPIIYGSIVALSFAFAFGIYTSNLDTDKYLSLAFAIVPLYFHFKWKYFPPHKSLLQLRLAGKSLFKYVTLIPLFLLQLVFIWGL